MFRFMDYMFPRGILICLHRQCSCQHLNTRPFPAHTRSQARFTLSSSLNATMFSLLRGFNPLKSSMSDIPAPYDKVCIQVFQVPFLRVSQLSAQGVQVVVVFGRTGMGISSVVNLILGQEEAPCHNDIHPCTVEPAFYRLEIDGQEFDIYDIPGFRRDFSPAKMIGRLHRERGIDLLINCIRPKDGTIKGYYNSVRAAVPDRVPIVAIVTGLEREGNNMEDWWTKNGEELLGKGLKFVDHACVTSLSQEDVSYNLECYGRKIESVKVARDLIVRCCN